MYQRIFLAAVAAVLISGGAYAADPAHAPAPAHGGGDHKPHWGYIGEAGPANWGDLSGDYHACKAGQSQSPIDIGNAPHQDAKPLAISYKPTRMRVVNNGHTIQANYDAGSTLTLDGKQFNLLQFHFHSPSEHTREKSAFPMEVHLVHKAEDGTLAVVGVFIKQGKENPFLAAIWKNMPTEVDHEQGEGNLNVADFLPSNKAFWNYSGSLTTPPCSEGVNWFVMDQPVEASEAQIKKFLGLVHENARPVQPLHDRKLIHRK
ncbi:MAG: carbonic anhydrase family protein [Nitrospirota bacterium]|nr:carbonic anhydrase family protein [Nitrospirota bacterium]